MADSEAIRRAVAEALRQHLGESPRPIIDEAAVNAAAEGSTLIVPPGALITPLARALAVERRVKLVEGRPAAATAEIHDPGKVTASPVEIRIRREKSPAPE